MTNAEKYKEVFGYDVKNSVMCTTEEFDPEECKYCLNRHKGVVGCEQWMNAEYKENKQ